MDLINYFLVGLFFLALFTALKKVNKSLALLAVVLGWAGVLLYFASNQAFALLALSDKFATSVTETQKVLFSAAGEALLVFQNPELFQHGTASYTSLLLLGLGGLLFSLIMLKSTEFNKATAWTGLLANGILLLFYVTPDLCPTVKRPPACDLCPPAGDLVCAGSTQAA